MAFELNCTGDPTVAGLGYSQVQLALLVVAIAAGSIIASHVNDGGFWIVSATSESRSPTR